VAIRRLGDALVRKQLAAINKQELCGLSEEFTFEN
jgi:hypothetical protein